MVLHLKLVDTSGVSYHHIRGVDKFVRVEGYGILQRFGYCLNVKQYY